RVTPNTDNKHILVIGDALDQPACIVLDFTQALARLEQTAGLRMPAKETTMLREYMRAAGHAPDLPSGRNRAICDQPHTDSQPLKPATAGFDMGRNLPAAAAQFHHEGRLAQVQHLIVE